MADNLITWNLPNWITVVLMVGLAFFLAGMVARVRQQKAGA